MAAPSNNNETHQRILIVDTETMSSELLQFRFEAEGFESDVDRDGEKALERDLRQYSLILVDLMKEPFNGLKFTRAVKRNPETFNIPVIIVSETAGEDDVVDGLDAGADDYIAKPYSSRELIARVRSVIRRRQMMSMRRLRSVVNYRDISLNLSAGTASLAGEELQLTRTEFLILAMFMRNRCNFFERSEIKHEAWEDDNDVSDRAVDTNISRLRKKLGEYGRHIVNRQGFGYGFVE